MSKKIAVDSLKLRAAIEFGDYLYTIKNGGHGPTLVVDAGTKEEASIARKKIPGNWEGLFVLVVYSQACDIEEENLYDPA
jgi:predicted sugar kinase